MKIGIETKYSIGDEVWLWSEKDNAPIRAKITSISFKYKMDAYDNDNYVHEDEELLYAISNEWISLDDCEEGELFRTPEELFRARVKKLEDKFKRLKHFNTTEMPDLKEKE